MDFIQTANKQADKFGSGKHGFQAGNPGAGVLATLLSNLWCDGVQQELINVIEAAGIAPSGASLSQLLAALRGAGVFQTQAVNDRTTKAATTAFANPAAVLSGSGYVKLPSGILIQWGSYAVAATNVANVTFPIAFPTGVWFAGPFNPSITIYAATVTASTSGAQFGLSASTTGGAAYIAIGY